MISDLIDSFMAWLRANDRSENTVTLYRKVLTSFARWFEQINGRPLDPAGLTPADVRLYRQTLLEQRRRPATVNAALAGLRAFGAFVAETTGGPNPAARIRPVAIATQAAPRSLSRQDVFRLRQALDRRLAYAQRKGHALAWPVRDEAIVMTLLHTGLRVDELCRLDLADLTLHERSGKLVVRHGKGAKHREVPLNADARRALGQWLKYRAGIAGLGEAQAVFVTRRRERMRGSAVQRLLRELSDEAGVRITPHTLRHTFARSLIDAGVGIEKVGALLGHSSLNTTRLYTTPTARDLEAAVGKLED